MKKLFSMLLVLAMLCTMLALASCGDEVTDTSSSSSEATSSEESVAPPTNAELFEAAMNSFDSYITPFTDVFSIDSEMLEFATGKANMIFSLNELSAMGESAIGEGPLKFTVNMERGTDVTKALAVMLAAGDEVKLDIYTKDDKQYVLLPDLYGDSVFDDVNLEEEGSDSDDSTISDTFLDDFKALLLKEENITIGEDGKTFTVTMGKADVDALLDLIEPLLGVTDGMDDLIDLGGTSEEPVETPEPDSAVFVLNIASETQATFTWTFKEGETVLTETTSTLSVLSGTTTFEIKSTANDAEVLTFSMTATDSAVTVEGEMNMAGIIVEVALEATKEGNTCTIDGTMSVTVDMSGMLLTIPFEIDGSFGVEDGTISMALSMSASLEGLMNIGVSMEMDLTPCDVTVTLPFDESDVAVLDAEDLRAKMQEVYPNASALLGISSGELSVVQYASEDGSLYFNIYSDDTAEIIANALTYEKTDDTITLYKNGTEFYSVSYTLENDSYIVYGQQYETIIGDIDTDGFLVDFYMFYDDSTYLDICLYDETAAGITMCYFYDTASEDLVFLLPDGNTVTYDIEMSEDGTTVTLLGETLSLVIE